MRKQNIIIVTLFLLFVFLIHSGHAGMINYNRINKNKGTTTTTQAATTTSQTTTPTTSSYGMTTTTPGWKTKLIVVMNRAEQKFDANNDGYLQRSEVVAYLQDVVKQVQSKGSLKINSDILAEYDKDGNKSIDRYEATDIMSDIGG
jgi:hypothetical protein